MNETLNLVSGSGSGLFARSNFLRRPLVDGSERAFIQTDLHSGSLAACC